MRGYMGGRGRRHFDRTRQTLGVLVRLGSFARLCLSLRTTLRFLIHGTQRQLDGSLQSRRGHQPLGQIVGGAKTQRTDG